MTQTFYGPWSVEVVSLEASFSERFVIGGSANADGAYDGTPGVSVQVSGDEWTLDLQWNDNTGSGWQPSDVRKTAEYTISDGLVVTLGADDNLDAVRDHDYNDVVLACRSMDPTIDPPATDPPLDFTITEDQLRRPADRLQDDRARRGDPR
jgi:hypothetical protein